MNDIRITSQLPFHYLVTVTLTSGQSLTQNLTLQQDSSFALSSLLASTTVDCTRSDGAAVTNPFSPNNFSVQITDQTTGRQLASARIPQRIIAPFQGYKLPDQVIFPPGAVLLFDFLDLSATNNVVSLVLAGYKVFGR